MKERRRTHRRAGWLRLLEIPFLALTGLALAVTIGRAETPAAASPVLLLGDSMMRLPGQAMERELARLPGIEAHSFSGIGTGLARLDAFDWLGKIDELCAEHRPKVAVVALGANDRQPMKLPGLGEVVQPGSAQWNEEYAARIGQAMDRLAAGGCDRIIWLLLPPMRDSVVDAFAQNVNQAIGAEAARRPGVTAHDFTPLVADRRTGGYTDRIMDPQTAAAIRVRDPDGIHLTPDGARLLATALIREYWP
jgi:hypothetical protein